MTRRQRPHLSARQRVLVRKKSGGRCHICGGRLGDKWAVDHVLAHSHGGTTEVENLLASCHTCNRLRWHFTAEEVREILQLGVYARAEIRDETPLGAKIRAMRAQKLRNVQKRRAPR